MCLVWTQVFCRDLASKSSRFISCPAAKEMRRLLSEVNRACEDLFYDNFSNYCEFYPNTPNVFAVSTVVYLWLTVLFRQDIKVLITIDISGCEKPPAIDDSLMSPQKSFLARGLLSVKLVSKTKDLKNIVDFKNRTNDLQQHTAVRNSDVFRPITQEC